MAEEKFLCSHRRLESNFLTHQIRASATQRAAYVIAYSADLQNWTPLTTNSLSPLDITNSVPGLNLRTYRMREVP